ncbi:MAG: hypothetical protein AVDCRST_MAG77-3536 [uncultured Chloroflexi bacterium]|uniref:Uncharacterized protein n=1 Tax=uncultured Chloroflexota bacterium TaxID=166587 RepID=A0A6J4JDQ5_9CHLR|nr:MAG: hypothetical protein AVDCRST_MAG77-3536 [uncultured Chloroflexota bacterium]
MGPIARMMMSVAAHAITGYVQFRTLSELLIEKGVITREELEGRFEATREKMVPATIEEWFEPDIAYHLKMAVQSATAAPDQEAAEADTEVVVSPNDQDELARARAMQSGRLTGPE